MLEVKINDNSDTGFNNAVKKFLKICNKDGFLREIRDRKYYKKPSEKRREYLLKKKREFGRKDK